jgi:NAD(P)H-dependent FMN reductase
MFKFLLVGCLAMAGSLSAETKVLAFAGSTRKDSCNKKLIENAAQMARTMGAEVTVIDLKDFPMPFYDADLEIAQGQPENAKKLRKLMLQSSGIIISSPEYNGSLSGVLKNAIDWASRNEEGKPSREAFLGKKFALMSCSPGPGGAAKGLVHLRAIIENIGGEVVPLELSVPYSESVFNPEGKLEKEQVQEAMQKELRQLLDVPRPVTS